MFYSAVAGTSIAGLISFLTLPYLHILMTAAPLPIFLLIFSGLLGQGLARTANYYSIKFVGAAKGNLLVNTAPLFALPFAFTFLGESFHINKIVGAILLTVAITLVSSGTRNVENDEMGGGNSSNKRGMFLGLLAAFLYAIARLLRKVVIDFLPYPLLNAFISNGVAIPLVLLEERQSGNKDIIHISRYTAISLCLAGGLQVLGLVLEFMAYETSEATIVIPVRSTTPLFTVILSSILLKKYEKITLQLLLSCIIAVLGITFLSI